MAKTKSVVVKGARTAEEEVELFAEVRRPNMPLLNLKTSVGKNINCNLSSQSDAKNTKKVPTKRSLVVTGKAIKLRERTPTDIYQVGNVPVVEYSSDWFKDPEDLEPRKGLVFNRFANCKNKNTKEQHKDNAAVKPKPEKVGKKAKNMVKRKTSVKKSDKQNEEKDVEAKPDRDEVEKSPRKTGTETNRKLDVKNVEEIKKVYKKIEEKDMKTKPNSEKLDEANKKPATKIENEAERISAYFKDLTSSLF